LVSDVDIAAAVFDEEVEEGEVAVTCGCMDSGVACSVR
jgi:hypothetical protein